MWGLQGLWGWPGRCRAATWGSGRVAWVPLPSPRFSGDDLSCPMVRRHLPGGQAPQLQHQSLPQDRKGTPASAVLPLDSVPPWRSRPCLRSFSPRSLLSRLDIRGAAWPMPLGAGHGTPRPFINQPGVVTERTCQHKISQIGLPRPHGCPQESTDGPELQGSSRGLQTRQGAKDGAAVRRQVLQMSAMQQGKPKMSAR